MKDTFSPSKVKTAESINLSISITNSGLVEAKEFTVLFNSQPNFVESLNIGEVKVISTNYTAPITPGIYNIPVIVDSENNIIESIETDNFYNATIIVE